MWSMTSSFHTWNSKNYNIHVTHDPFANAAQESAKPDADGLVSIFKMTRSFHYVSGSAL